MQVNMKKPLVTFIRSVLVTAIITAIPMQSSPMENNNRGNIQEPDLPAIDRENQGINQRHEIEQYFENNPELKAICVSSLSLGWIAFETWLGTIDPDKWRTQKISTLLYCHLFILSSFHIFKILNGNTGPRIIPNPNTAGEIRAEMAARATAQNNQEYFERDRLILERRAAAFAAQNNQEERDLRIRDYPFEDGNLNPFDALKRLFLFGPGANRRF